MDTEKTAEAQAAQPASAETGTSVQTGTPVETPTSEWKSWVISAGIAAVILLVIVVYRTHKASSSETASRMLGEARNIEALKAVVNQYPRTPAAQVASLLVAKSQYDGGDYGTASASYNDFLTRHPKHTLAPVAELGKLHCLEAMGQTTEALNGYTTFSTKHPTHYLAPLALFGKARCLEQAGRIDEAKIVYEDFLASHPKSEWKDDVEEYLKQIERKTRKPSVRL